MDAELRDIEYVLLGAHLAHDDTPQILRQKVVEIQTRLRLYRCICCNRPSQSSLATDRCSESYFLFSREATRCVQQFDRVFAVLHGARAFREQCLQVGKVRVLYGVKARGRLRLTNSCREEARSRANHVGEEEVLWRCHVDVDTTRSDTRYAIA